MMTLFPFTSVIGVAGRQAKAQHGNDLFLFSSLGGLRLALDSLCFT